MAIVSCGGNPYDINLIQAHKALEAASYACADGGTIIWLAECPDGLGRADFMKWFDAADARALATRLHEHYEVNGQTAWTLLEKAERFRVILVSSLDAADVRRMRLIPARTLSEALSCADAGAQGYVLQNGAVRTVVSGL